MSLHKIAIGGTCGGALLWISYGIFLANVLYKGMETYFKDYFLPHNPGRDYSYFTNYIRACWFITVGSGLLFIASMLYLIVEPYL